jgi:heat shock protein HtpX
MNHLKSVMLLATLTALVLWAGQALGRRGGFMAALGVTGVMHIGAFWWPDKLILRMYGAEEVSPDQAPALWAMVRDLATHANLPMPRVYIIPEEARHAAKT